MGPPRRRRGGPTPALATARERHRRGARYCLPLAYASAPRHPSALRPPPSASQPRRRLPWTSLAPSPFPSCSCEKVSGTKRGDSGTPASLRSVRAGCCPEGCLSAIQRHFPLGYTTQRDELASPAHAGKTETLSTSLEGRSGIYRLGFQSMQVPGLPTDLIFGSASVMQTVGPVRTQVVTIKQQPGFEPVLRSRCRIMRSVTGCL